MFYYGSNYGLNYGVSLPTVRQIAREQTAEHELALYLYKQQVRELRLAALHIAEPERITVQELPTWEEGVINSEVAEEMAFALLPRTTILKDIFDKWSRSDNEFLAYSALMAAARSEIALDENRLHTLPSIVERFTSSRIIAQGVVAMLATAYERNADTKSAIQEILDKMGDGPASEYIKDEISWRIEY
jgi:3-methyladenine DNA glycosylase AlkD